MPKATPKELLHLAVFFSGSSDKLLLSAILWIAAAMAIWRDRLLPDKGEIFWRGSLVISWAVVPIVLMALISLRNPVFVQRYLIFCLPATMILAGRGMVALPKHQLGLWLVLLLCVSSLISVFLGYRKPREDWRSVTATVLASAKPGDGVVIYPFFARPGFDYYYDLRGRSAPPLRMFARFYETGEDEQSLYRALEENPPAMHHVWILMRDEGRRPAVLSDYSSQLAAKLQSAFGEPRQQQYEGITLLEYGQ
jgi:hypothetical protein